MAVNAPVLVGRWVFTACLSWWCLQLLERTRSACTWLPRVLTSLAMADEQVRVMMYSLLESDDPTKIRQGALCIVFELDDIMRAIRRGLHVRWETNQAADAWHTRLHDRLEKARTLAMHQFSWWRDRDHTTAALFLRTLSKVVAGFGLLGQYNTMMNLTQVCHTLRTPRCHSTEPTTVLVVYLDAGASTFVNE